MLRSNSYRRNTEDQYGNTFNSMQPKGSILLKNKPKLDNSVLNQNIYDPNKTIKDAQNYTNSLKPMEVKKAEKVDIDPVGALASTTQAVTSTFKNNQVAPKVENIPNNLATPKAGLLSKNMSTGAAAGVAGTSAVAGIVGNNMTSNKKEVGGGILAGAGAGASMGLALGTVVPGLGNAVGAAAGALVGGVVGGIKGSKDKKKRLDLESKEKKAIDDYNLNLSNVKRKTLGQATDLAALQRIMNSSSNYDSKGNLKFKKGGVLPYSSIHKDELLGYIQKQNEKTSNFIKESINGIPTKLPSVKKDVIPIFRRGGEIDIKKSNVILNGPSHEEENETGLKGDRGLPVVMKNVKVAEIESEELVLSKESMQKLEGLIKQYKETGDLSIKKEIGEFLYSELKDNTYDYSELMKD